MLLATDDSKAQHSKNENVEEIRSEAVLHIRKN